MPPAIIAAATLATTAAGVGASTLMAHKGLKQAKSAQEQQMDIAAKQQELSKQFFDRGTPAFNQAFDYYSGLLSNDQNQVMKAIGPDASMIGHQFDAAKNNLLNNSYSRGGGLNRGMSNLDAGRATSISNLIGGVRPTAATALANLGTGQQQMGLSALNGGLQGLAGAQNAQFNNQLLNQQAMGGIGSFITRMLSNPSLFGGGNNFSLTPNGNPAGFNSIIGNTSSIPAAVVNPNQLRLMPLT